MTKDMSDEKIPYVAVGNGELCPFCKKVTITAESGSDHIIACLQENRLIAKDEKASR